MALKIVLNPEPPFYLSNPLSNTYFFALYPIVDIPSKVPRRALITTMLSLICSPYGILHIGKKALTNMASAGSAIIAIYFRTLYTLSLKIFMISLLDYPII
jgi:hypothetical protein